MTGTNHRDTLSLEQAPILTHRHHPGDQHILRVHAPECAASARPGSFVHMRCHPLLPMRRPLSIMRISRQEGWVDFLYKSVGTGTRLLASRQPGEHLDLLGPIGEPFRVHRERPRPLLIGGGVGMPPMVFLAESLRRQPDFQVLALLASEVPFPFQPRPSQLLVPHLPDGTIACMPLLDDWRIPSRLASLKAFPGCYPGYVTELAEHWLVGLNPNTLRQVELFACGPWPMLEAVAVLAARFGLPCQVSLEEFMACGVGGCAGCAVQLETAHGPTMQRVCVDGPVFDASEVFPPPATLPVPPAKSRPPRR